MNDIIKNSSHLPANFGENLMKGIADTRSTLLVSDGGKPLLRLLKTGKWVFGQQNEPVEKGSEWAVNIASLSRGWVCWGDGELLGQVMASVQTERAPQPNPINGEPFVEQFGMELTCISGAHEGVLVAYRNSSVGFKRAFEKLLAEIQTRYSLDKQYFWPVVELSQESYPHKKYGEIFNPLLPVVAWCDEQGAFSPDSEVDEEPEEIAPPPSPPARKRGRPPTAAPAAAIGAEPWAESAPQPTVQAHVGQRRRPIAR